MHIKKLYIVAIVIFINSKLSFSQQSPPAAYGSTATINYVRTWDVLAPTLDPNTLTNTTPISIAKMSTEYLDGLGRTLQIVQKQVAPSCNDLVAAIYYDQFGREQSKYLPFVSTQTSSGTEITNDGLFKKNPFQQQAAFYNSSSSPISGQGETYFYGQTVFEPSALNRVNQIFAAGNSWIGSSVSTQLGYFLNTTLDNVQVWNVNDVSGNFGTYTTSSTYPVGTLFKLITTDEKSNQVIEFKDKMGRIILKKVQLTATADNGNGSGYLGWASTYYIYDDLGQLRCVIQPEAINTLFINNTWDIVNYSGGILLSEQCFRYEYDQRGRMKMKIVPGKGEMDMVYDARDRLIMTQDANLKAKGKWLVTEYDLLNRPWRTGLLTDANTNSYHQNNAYNSTSYPNTSSGYEVLSQTGYDDYSTLPTIAPSKTFDQTYYTSSNFNTSYNAAPEYAQQVQQSFQTRSMPTWQMSEILDGSNRYLYQVNIYNDKGQSIQLKNTNILSGTDLTTIQFNFSGKLLRSHIARQVGTTVYQILSHYSYDNTGRIISIAKKVNNNSTNNTTEKTIVQNSYDELGKLRSKTLGASIETQTFDYNIRGWLLGANRKFVQDQTTNFFGYDLGYDKSGVIGSYNNHQTNGNIAGLVWKTAGDGSKRKYDFTYDAFNRLLSGDFNQWVSGIANSALFDKSASLDFSVSGLTYDLNGNIKTMNQMGWKVNQSVYIDQLVYGYYSNSNKLQVVTDNANDNTSTLGDFKYNPGSKTGTDYTYDGNGNLSSDNNKTINSFSYNYLNLPNIISITSKGTVTYTYDAAGTKLQKLTVENASPSNNQTQTNTTTSYLGEVIFQTMSHTVNGITTTDYTNQLQLITHEEGRVRWNQNSGAFVYDYFLKDHLGNVRMMLTEDQITKTYPAATLEGSTANGALSMVNYESQFYSIDYLKITPTSSISGWSSSLDYYNNNGNPPYNSIAAGSYPSNYTVNDGGTSTSMYKVNATANKTGLGIIIKVMAGDHIDIWGRSFYYSSGQSFTNSNSTALTLDNIFSAFINNPNGTTFSKGLNSTQLQTLNSGTYGLPSNLIRGSDGSSSSIPKAYINYIFFDDQLRYTGSGFSQVGSPNNTGVKQHWNDPSMENIPAPKNGYMFVYVSNESNYDVYFDNLQIIHKPGPILEETHYYPNGLIMQGISSSSLNFGLPNNIYKFNGKKLENKEFKDGSGLEWYDYGMREYDHQIGRFFRIDPLSEKFFELTPYQYASNNPITNIDLDGLEGIPFQLLTHLIQKTVQNPNGTEAKVLGAVGGLGQAVVSTGEGLYNVVRHPIQTIQGITKLNTLNGQISLGINFSLAINEKVNKFKNGTSFDKWFIGSEFAANLGIAIFGTKGLQAFLKSSKSVWALSATERGFEVEAILGGNLPSNFPVIDKLVDGVATSIKSIDLTAQSYLKGNTLLNTLKGYINKLDNFTTGTSGGVTVSEGINFESKALELAIQPGKATISQWEQIAKAIKYANDNNIQFILRFIR